MVDSLTPSSMNQTIAAFFLITTEDKEGRVREIDSAMLTMIRRLSLNDCCNMMSGIRRHSEPDIIDISKSDTMNRL